MMFTLLYITPMIWTPYAIQAYMMTQQIDPQVRLNNNKSATENNQRQCESLGMDQGFHNWLVYSGKLDKYMDVRIFQQGEGPVNTMGGFYGERKRLKFPLDQWGILQGERPNQYIANWNGDRSPVVHQLDRFLGGSDMSEILDVLHDLPSERND